ncbi:MAG: WD40 repeat domain-containing protein [Chloroflexota bacterium]
MDNSTDNAQMEILFKSFIKSCFAADGGDPDIRLDLEIGDLLQLKGIYLEKAKVAILEGLEKNQGFRPVYSAKALNLREAVPIMKKWLGKIKNTPTSMKDSRAYQLLASTLYAVTEEEAYIPDMVEAVKKADYSDLDESVPLLSKAPLTTEGVSAVWQRYKKGKVTKETDNWLNDCADFLREKIKHPIGENFLKNLPEEEQKALLKLISESRKNRIERNSRLEKYIRGRDRYNQGDLNRYDEYVKVGGSPIKGLKLKSIWKGHTDEVNSLVWSPDGHYLASASKDESIMIWDVELGDCTTLLIREKKFGYSKYEPKRAIWLGSEKLASTYDYYSVSDEDVNRVAIWNLQSKKLISSVQKKGENKNYVRNLIYSPYNNSLIVSYYGHEDNAVFLIDPATSERKCILKEYDGIFETMTMSPDGKIIVAGYQELAETENSLHEIIFIDSSTMKVINKLPGHFDYINHLCWMSGRPVLASASSDNKIGVWDYEHIQRLAFLEGHRGIVSDVSFSAGGKLLASRSCEDNTLRIWDTKTWETLAILRELNGFGDSFAFHPTLPILASICKDETQEKVFRHDVNSIRIWEFDYEEFLDNPPFMNGFMK